MWNPLKLNLLKNMSQCFNLSLSTVLASQFSTSVSSNFNSFIYDSAIILFSEQYLKKVIFLFLKLPATSNFLIFISGYLNTNALCSKKTWYRKNSIPHKNRKRKGPTLGNTENSVCLVKKPTTAYRALS